MAGRIAARDMYGFFERILTEAGIATKRLEDGVEYHVRVADGATYEFYINPTRETKAVEHVCGMELLTEQAIDGVLELAPYAVAVIEKN